jgi:hypothetical protein
LWLTKTFVCRIWSAGQWKWLYQYEIAHGFIPALFRMEVVAMVVCWQKMYLGGSDREL